MKYNRARLEIAYDILAFIRTEIEGAKPTHILYKANLSPELLKRYLKILLNDGFIKKFKIENKVRYKITKMGIKFINSMNSLDKMTSIFSLPKEDRSKAFK